MDEILASIRKIISDDEPGEAPQPEDVSAEPGAPAGTGSTEDPTGAINDTQAGTGSPDDILDLTQVVEPPQQTAASGANAQQGDALESALAGAGGADTAAAPDPAPGEPDISALLAQAGIEDTSVEAHSAAEPAGADPAADDLSAILGRQDEAATTSESEKSSITEALSALDAPATETAPQAMDDAFMTEGAPEVASEPAVAPVEASIDKGVFAPETEAEPASPPPAVPPEIPEVPEVPEAQVAPETAADYRAPGDSSSETVHDVVAEAPQTAEPVAAPEAPVEEIPAAGEGALPGAPDIAAPEDKAASGLENASLESASASPENSDGKTLEDSVKDMLRPMLREWLDDNMERIVQETVKEEVASGDNNL
jgi:cell pole-organizing protein PopZ